MKSALTLAVSALLTLLLTAGCSDSVDVTWYEAGVYKGSDDPLTDKLKADELQEELVRRLHRVQTDR